MNLLCCLNDKYLYPLINMVYSIRKFNSSKIDLYLLTTSFSLSKEKLLRKKIKKLNINLNIIRVELNENFTEGYSHYSIDMYLRIFAFDILPERIKKVLYLDVDLILLNDINKLYLKDISDKKIAAVRDNYFETSEIIEYCKKMNIDHDYFNSGVLLMNLENMRKSWNKKEIIDFIKSVESQIRYPDQDVLNIMCSKDDLLLLEKDYNYQIRYESKEIDFENTLILHYVAKIKPWNHFKLKYHEKLFWKNFKNIKCCNFYIISFFSSLKMKIDNILKITKRFIKKIIKR